MPDLLWGQKEMVSKGRSCHLSSEQPAILRLLLGLGVFNSFSFFFEGRFRSGEHVRGTWRGGSDSAWLLRHESGRGTFGAAPFPGVAREQNSLSPRPLRHPEDYTGASETAPPQPCDGLCEGLRRLLVRPIVRNTKSSTKSIYVDASFISLKTQAV